MMPASIDENGLREAPADAPPPEESSKSRPGEGGLVLHRVRQVGLVVATLLGTAYFLSVVHEHHPITEWLFWTFAEAWALALIWAAGCLSTGHAVLRLLLARVLPIGEQITLAFAVGVLAFFLAMFATGLVGLYRPWLFFVLPLVFLAAGARPTFRYGRRLRGHLVWLRARPRASRSPLWLAPLAFGALSLALVYVATFPADHVAYDAQWYHLGIAEHYIASRGVVRFREGWFLGTYPQLASYVYTWAFLLPGTDLYGRLQLASHVEVVVFLFTLGGIPALVRRLVPGVRAPLAWTALFLFPGIFIYDSNLNLSADHIAALWPVPIFLALLRTWQSWSPRFAILLAALLAGALNTKYTAIIVAILPLLAFSVRAIGLGVHRRATWPPILAALATGLLLTAPHWAKNWIWYGNPLYPSAHTLFKSFPWTEDCVIPFEKEFLTEWTRPPRTWEGVKEHRC